MPQETWGELLPNGPTGILSLGASALVSISNFEGSLTGPKASGKLLVLGGSAFVIGACAVEADTEGWLEGAIAPWVRTAVRVAVAAFCSGGMSTAEAGLSRTFDADAAVE